MPPFVFFMRYDVWESSVKESAAFATAAAQRRSQRSKHAKASLLLSSAFGLFKQCGHQYRVHVSTPGETEKKVDRY